jgi:hypothetical protein
MFSEMDDSRAQSEWDRKCAAAPRCDCCGGSVYPYSTYTEIGEFVFCEKCAGNSTVCYTEDLEL